MAKFSKYNQPKRNRRKPIRRQSESSQMLYDQMCQLTANCTDDKQRQMIIDAYNISK
jgi:hypothetical protein